MTAINKVITLKNCIWQKIHYMILKDKRKKKILFPLKKKDKRKKRSINWPFTKKKVLKKKGVCKGPLGYKNLKIPCFLELSPKRKKEK